MSRLFRPVLACAALAAAALVLSGCLGGDGGGDEISGITEIAPADASFYLDAVVRPEGEPKEQLDSFLSAVLATDDPGQEIIDLFDRELADQAQKYNFVRESNFEADIEPWLGDEGGLFVVGTEDDPPVLVALASDDPEAGVEYIRSQSKNLVDGEYEGVSYQLDEQKQAFGELEGFVVYGDEEALKAAVDASKQDSLADSEQFNDAVEDVPEEAIGRIYADLDQVSTALARSFAEGAEIPPGVAGDAFEQLEIGQSLVASLVPEEKTLALDIEGAAGEKAAETPDVLNEVPFDAFLAVGISDVGAKAKDLIAAIEEFGVPGLSRDVIAAGLELQAGLDLEEDVLSWPGDAAFFLRGTDVSALEGVLVIDSKDNIAAAKTLDGIRQVIEAEGQGNAQPLELGGGGGSGFELETPGFPQPLNFVQRNERVAIGLGDAATEQALNPTETLADAPEFKTATATLGEGGPALYLSLPEAVGLLEQTPDGQTPDFEQAKPYLERLAFLTAGGSEGGFRIVLGAE